MSQHVKLWRKIEYNIRNSLSSQWWGMVEIRVYWTIESDWSQSTLVITWSLQAGDESVDNTIFLVIITPILTFKLPTKWNWSVRGLEKSRKLIIKTFFILNCYLLKFKEYYLLNHSIFISTSEALSIFMLATFLGSQGLYIWIKYTGFMWVTFKSHSCSSRYLIKNSCF